MFNDNYKWVSSVINSLIWIVGLGMFLYNFENSSKVDINQFEHFIKELEWYLYLIFIFEFANILIGKFRYGYSNGGISLNLSFLALLIAIIINIACSFPIYVMSKPKENEIDWCMIFFSINLVSFKILSAIYEYKDKYVFLNTSNIKLKSSLKI